LSHLHRRGIIHRDIKPENILLSANGVPKLSDFGTAYVQEGETQTHSVPICTLSSGTLPYMAPEMLTRSKLHSYQCDYWSLGVTAYELLFNCRPSVRNCPKRFIYFSANQYHYLWGRLLTAQQSSVSAAASVGPIDFDSIDQSISSADREAVLSFPDSCTPLLLEGELELPFELTTPIPLRTYAGEKVSRECMQFLQSMLDVRVPRRLGQLSQFDLFSEHVWFRSNQCVIPASAVVGEVQQSLPLPPSPYEPNLILLENHLHMKYKNDSLLQSTSPSSSPSPSSPALEMFIPDHIERKLECYSYSPSSSKPPRRSLPTTSSHSSSSEQIISRSPS
jgi:serine/threonine protein kinase